MQERDFCVICCDLANLKDNWKARRGREYEALGCQMGELRWVWWGLRKLKGWREIICGEEQSKQLQTALGELHPRFFLLHLNVTLQRGQSRILSMGSEFSPSILHQGPVSWWCESLSSQSTENQSRATALQLAYSWLAVCRAWCKFRRKGCAFVCWFVTDLLHPLLPLPAEHNFSWRLSIKGRQWEQRLEEEVSRCFSSCKGVRQGIWVHPRHWPPQGLLMGSQECLGSDNGRALGVEARPAWWAALEPKPCSWELRGSSCHCVQFACSTWRAKSRRLWRAGSDWEGWLGSHS